MNSNQIFVDKFLVNYYVFGYLSEQNNDFNVCGNLHTIILNCYIFEVINIVFAEVEKTITQNF